MQRDNKPRFFDSLGQLYNTINEQETAYEQTIDIIKDLQYRISTKILEYIKENENIDVRGKSYDKDGISEGFDYSEFYLHNISNTSFRVNSVDEISDKTSIVTLLCEANISANCFYEDYDNAPWDSEIKDYVFVETIEMREKHNARFCCRIELNREEKTFKILPFTVILGSDSRKCRYEIEEQPDIDYEQEIKDMDRETLGFTPLGSYESYLEEDLPNSDMSKEIIKRFEQINALHTEFEDFCNSYDLLLEKLSDIYNARKIIKLISKELEEISDFPGVIDEDEIAKEEIEHIIKWVELKLEKVAEIAEEVGLQDYLNYDEDIVIKGIDFSEIVLSLDEITISPTEGSEECIDIYLLKGQEKLLLVASN